MKWGALVGSAIVMAKKFSPFTQKKKKNVRLTHLVLRVKKELHDILANLIVFLVSTSYLCLFSLPFIATLFFFLSCFLGAKKMIVRLFFFYVILLLKFKFLGRRSFIVINILNLCNLSILNLLFLFLLFLLVFIFLFRVICHKSNRLIGLGVFQE